MQRALAISLLVLFFGNVAIAQIIRGEALEMDSNKPLDGVAIENIYTNVNITTLADGSFVIAGAPDQLLEFRKEGYKVTRVRIPRGYLPSFFRIILEKGYTTPLDSKEGNRYDPKKDSIRFREMYRQQLDFPRLSAVEKIKSPFSALSKKNRMTWQFQEDYTNFEKEKYVDFTFNKDLVTRITGLSGDSLNKYMNRFRPSYEQLRGMSDYAFYTYVKTSVRRYRTPNVPRGAQ
jgi:hypothetical protein